MSLRSFQPRPFFMEHFADSNLKNQSLVVKLLADRILRLRDIRPCTNTTHCPRFHIPVHYCTIFYQSSACSPLCACGFLSTQHRHRHQCAPSRSVLSHSSVGGIRARFDEAYKLKRASQVIFVGKTGTASLNKPSRQAHDALCTIAESVIGYTHSFGYMAQLQVRVKIQRYEDQNHCVPFSFVHITAL